MSSYQLHCPNCSTAIQPENINVQKTIAACQACGAVFDFSERVPSLSTTAKAKRRKIKQPDYMTVSETEDAVTLHMPYITTMPYKMLSSIGAGTLSLLYLAIAGAIVSRGRPDMVTDVMLFSVIFIPFIIGFIASWFAKQSITLNSEQLKHEVRLGVLLYQRKIEAQDLVDVSTDEMTSTKESIAEARYNVYAEKADGRQDMFMQNLPEEMAFYTEQVLSAHAQADVETSNLRIQDAHTDDDDVILYDEDTSSAHQQQQM